MLELTEVEALLGTVLDEDDTSLRTAGLEALTHLPLSDDGWKAIAPHVIRLLATAVPGTQDRWAAIQLAARVPLASVVAELRRIAADDGDPDGPAARELLHQQSGADVDAVLERVPAEPDDDPAEVEGLDDRVLDRLLTREQLDFDQVSTDTWGRLSSRQAARVVTAAVRRIADGVDTWDPDELPWLGIDAGNSLVTVVSMMPSGIDLPIGDLYELHRRTLRGVIPDSQVACVLAKADPAKTVAFFARAVPALEPEERAKAFDMLARIGDFERGAPGPIVGPGPGPGSSPPLAERIDDVHLDFGPPPGGALPPPPPAVGAEPPPAVGAEPPASAPAWPHLQAPAAAVAGEVFPIEVGLGQARDAGLDGTGALSVPAGDYSLGVELMIDGFAVVGDRTFTIDVTAADRFPKRTVQLLALAAAGLAERRRIGVVYRIGNEMRGYAGREVAVKATAAEASAVAPPPAPAPGSIDTSAFATAGAADLTLVIQLGAAADGSRLIWSAVSPHLDLAVPAEAPVSELGSSPQEFLAELVDEASTTPDTLNLYASLVGRGKSQIARRMPAAVRQALHQVAEKVAPRPPSVLLVSQDPYVPWELAVLDPALPGTPAGGSPFLGAQAAMARWILQTEPPPPIDPPRHVDVRSTALVTGVYEEVPDWNRLESAEREVDELERGWPSPRRVEARLPAVLDCINGEPAADIIHFALHGQFGVDGARQGLVLIDTVPGHPDQKEAVFLKPSHVASGQLNRHPFVFLNACQVGANRVVLGNYSGMAGDFVGIGASGVVAPLWSVNDEVASDFALEFYQATLDRGETPAEALRAARAKVTKAAVEAGAPEASGTRLAYQFFGHPNMRLTTAGGTG